MARVTGIDKSNAASQSSYPFTVQSTRKVGHIVLPNGLFQHLVVYCESVVDSVYISAINVQGEKLVITVTDGDTLKGSAQIYSNYSVSLIVSDNGKIIGSMSYAQQLYTLLHNQILFWFGGSASLSQDCLTISPLCLQARAPYGASFIKIGDTVSRQATLTLKPNVLLQNQANSYRISLYSDNPGNCDNAIRVLHVNNTQFSLQNKHILLTNHVHSDIRVYSPLGIVTIAEACSV